MNDHVFKTLVIRALAMMLKHMAGRPLTPEKANEWMQDARDLL